MAGATSRFGKLGTWALRTNANGYRETVKRILNLPEGTNIVWRSHDESIAQRTAIDQARHEKSHQGQEKRRVTSTDDSQRDKIVTGS